MGRAVSAGKAVDPERLSADMSASIDGMPSRKEENSASEAWACSWAVRKPWGCAPHACACPALDDAWLASLELPAYAEDPAAKEDEDCPFPLPKRPDEEALFNSSLDGAAKALRASPVADDATLLRRLFIGFDEEDEASLSFDGSAVVFPFPFESLISSNISIHRGRSEG